MYTRETWCEAVSDDYGGESAGLDEGFRTSGWLVVLVLRYNVGYTEGCRSGWRSVAPKRKHRRYFLFKQAEERKALAWSDTARS